MGKYFKVETRKWTLPLFVGLVLLTHVLTVMSYDRRGKETILFSAAILGIMHKAAKYNRKMGFIRVRKQVAGKRCYLTQNLKVLLEA